MKFKAKVKHHSHDNDFPLVLQALQDIKKSAQNSVVWRLSSHKITLACWSADKHSRHERSAVQVGDLFSEFRIESRRSNRIDLEIYVDDLAALLMICDENSEVTIRLAVDVDDDTSPILAFEFKYLQSSLWCCGKVAVRVLENCEADAIIEMSIAHVWECPPPESQQRLSDMHNDRLFTDAVLELGDESLHIHRAVAAAASPVMRAMFESSMQEGIGAKILLRETTASAAHALIDFMYGKEIPNVAPLDLVELFVLGHFYGMDTLVTTCVDRLKERVTGIDELADVLKAIMDYCHDPAIVAIVQPLCARLWQHARQDQSGFFRIVGLAALSAEDGRQSVPPAKRRRFL